VKRAVTWLIGAAILLTLTGCGAREAASAPVTAPTTAPATTAVTTLPTTAPTTATTTATTTLTTAVPTAAPTAAPKAKPVFFVDGFTPSASLVERMNAVIRGDAYDTGFYLQTLDGSVSAGYNEYGSFFGACTIKTPLALYVFREIEAGRVSLDMQIKGESLDSLFNRMIVPSDVDAYHTVKNHFGKQTVNTFTRSLGLDSFQITTEWGYTTAYDAVKLWQQLYAFCQSSDTGGHLWQYFLDAYWNTVSEALGGQYPVAHKIGFNPKAPYVYADNSLVEKPAGARSYAFAYYTTFHDEDLSKSSLPEIIRILDDMMAEYDAAHPL
jgi:hypothetical protein